MNIPFAIGGDGRRQVAVHLRQPLNAVSGFTLIELMIVVMIVGILSSIALPAYSGYTAKAQASEAFVLVDPVQMAVRDYYARWGRFPDSNVAAGVALPEAYRGRFVRSIEVTAGGAIRIQVETGSKHIPPFSVYLRPALPVGSENGSMSWFCDKGELGYGADIRKQFVISGEVGKDTVQKNDVLPRACRV